MTVESRRALKVVFLRRNIDEPFTYLAPGDGEYLGYPVVVPLGNQLTVGLVIEEVELVSADGEKLKEVTEKLANFPPLPADLIALGRWVSEYYISPVNRVFEAIMPARYLPRPFKRWRLKNPDFVPEDIDVEFCEFLKKQKTFAIDQAKGFFNNKKGETTKKLQELVKAGYLEEKIKFKKPDISIKKLNYLTIARPLPKTDLSGRRRELIEFISPDSGCFQKDLPDRLNATALLCKMEKEGLIRREKKKIRRTPFTGYREKEAFVPEKLTSEQQNVLETIRESFSGGYSAHLLHGVTGSGKTEIYFRLVQETLQRGKTALVLVPEITLAAFLLEKFKARFGEQLAILHSELSAGERSDEWRRVRSGEARVVLGVQSAVFAPLVDPGLVIVDEEHDSSYKSGQTPRYHARDVAVMRARLAGIPVLLGSATPALESITNVFAKKYNKLQMVTRPAGGELPEVLIEDLRGSDSLLTDSLLKKTTEVLQQGKKAIWFLNRRGYSNFLICSECGNTVDCNNCNISLTPHSKPARLCCHYCGYSRPIPKTCPDCGKKLQIIGLGTQQLNRRARKLFPEHTVIRMDADTVTARGSRSRLLRQFARADSALLLGTQMVTKGLDFGGVDFVGVVNADSGLQFPDFRSGEKTFQQLVQVCGRAGRSHSGATVLVQTYNPGHYSIQYGVKSDYNSFYCHELDMRKSLRYPPFTRLINFIGSGRSEEQVVKTLNSLREFLPSSSAELLGPVPCGINYLKGKYRWHLLARGHFDRIWRCQAMKSLAKLDPAVRISVDVDPTDVI
ncbi:MAG: primosomal protein N' [bacterium]